MRILHAYADQGVESEALAIYGDVTRVGLNPESNWASEAIACDAQDLPFPDGSFDFGLFHPPCTKWSDMPDANKNGQAPDLIADARSEAMRVCEHWVIENKPRAPLNTPVVLEGKQFGLPIKYARAFETSFPVNQPVRQQSLATQTSPFFYTERSGHWWRSVKGGIRGDYTTEHIAKNSLPLQYVHYLARAWLTETGVAQGVADYSNYDEQMETRRRQAVNEDLAAFGGDV